MPDPITAIIILVVAAIVLSFLEICTPSFGMLTVAAITAIAAAIYFACTISPWAGAGLAIGVLIAMPIYLGVLVRLLPKTPLGKRLFLAKAPDSTGDAMPQAEAYNELIGKTGVAETQLRPSGTVRIDGKRIMARAESDIIEDGTEVKVIRADSMNVIVKPVSEQ